MFAQAMFPCVILKKRPFRVALEETIHVVGDVGGSNAVHRIEIEMDAERNARVRAIGIRGHTVKMVQRLNIESWKKKLSLNLAAFLLSL